MAARIAGAVLLVLVGIFHLVVLPTHWSAAPWLGILFVLAAAGAWLAAAGIAARGMWLAWVLGALVAASTFGGLLLAVTAGLPGFTETLSAPLAIPSLVVEGLYLLLAGVAAERYLATPRP